MVFIVFWYSYCFVCITLHFFLIKLFTDQTTLMGVAMLMLIVMMENSLKPLIQSTRACLCSGPLSHHLIRPHQATSMEVGLLISNGQFTQVLIDSLYLVSTFMAYCVTLGACSSCSVLARGGYNG